MTLLGKILVWVQVVFSLIFLSMAMSLYFQRTNWNDSVTPDGEKVRGQVTELRDRVAKLIAARDTAEPRYDAFTTELKALEAERPKRQAFHAEQLLIAATGVDSQGKPVDPPVQQLVFEGGKLALTKTGRPAIRINDAPALSLKEYAERIEKVYADIKTDQATIARLVAQADALTRKINGTVPFEDAVTPEEKGLRGELIDWRRHLRAAQLERQFLLTPITNYTVDVELLRQRRLSLEKRLNELNRAVSQTAASAGGRGR